MQKRAVVAVLLLLFGSMLFGMGSFLQPSEAFKPYIKKIDEQRFEAGVVIAKDIYIYDESLKLEINSTAFAIAEMKRPTPVEHHGDNVHLTSPKIIVTLQKSNADISGIQKVTFTLRYQGCSEAGLCYEPYTKQFSFDVDTAKFIQSKTIKKRQAIQQVQKSQQDMIADTIKNGSLWVILVSFFVFGLLLALTPCVFPMIPILSGVIVSQGEGVTTKKAFLLSLVYVLAMAVAYAGAGVLSGYFGSSMQAAMQTPWVIYSFALIFMLLALSMFGVYELKLPDALVSKVSSKPNRGGYIGVAVMGFLSALIVGPCVAAPLTGALVYIGQTGDALLGGVALFVMALGMGMPLLLVGMSAGKLMPRPGGWMTMVNVIFGYIMLVVAVWMLSKVLAEDVIMLLYALLGLSLSVYLGIFESGVHVVKKSVALIVFLYALVVFVGYMGGSTNVYKPLRVFQGGGVSGVVPQNKLNFKVVQSLDELDALLEKNKGKKVLLDFAAQWCESCKELDEKTFHDPRVMQRLQEYVLIRADLTKNSPEQKKLSKKYGVFGPPVVIFIDEAGDVYKSNTVVGYVPPEEFLKYIP